MSLQCHCCAQILDRGVRCLGRDLHYPRKTTSDTTCPSHQESAWRAAEARQEKVILAIVVGPLLLGNVGICVAHI